MFVYSFSIILTKKNNSPYLPDNVLSFKSLLIRDFTFYYIKNTQNNQDCEDEPTKSVIESYKEVTFMRQPDQSDIFVLPKEKKFKGYYKIARHYGWALNTTFSAGFEYVIIVEGK